MIKRILGIIISFLLIFNISVANVNGSQINDNTSVNVTVENQNIKIWGKTKANINVSVKVVDPKDEVNHINQIISDKEGNYKLEYKLNENAIEGTYKVKIAGEGIPAIEKSITYKKDSIIKDNNITLQITEDKKVHISGKTKPNINVSVKVLDPKDELNYINQIMTDKEGNYKFEYKLNEKSVQGIYKIRIAGEGIEAFEKTLKYDGQATKIDTETKPTDGTITPVTPTPEIPVIPIEKDKIYVNMRIEGYKGTHFDERIEFNPEDYRKDGKYKIKDPDGEEHEFNRPTVFLATIVAWNKKNIKDNNITSNDNYMARMAGEQEKDFSEHATCGWMYRINDVVSNKGGGEQSIKNGDTIEWYYTDLDTKTNFGYLDVNSTNIEVGGKIKVKASGCSNTFGGKGSKSVIEDASVYVGSKEYKTDKKGEVEIKMDETGNFDVYAIKYDTSSKHNGCYFPQLSKTKKVTVKVTSPNTLFKEAFKEVVKFNSTEYEKIYKEIEDMKKEDDALRKTKSTIEDLAKKVDSVKEEKELVKIIKDIKDVSNIAKLCSYKIESQKGGVEAVKNNNDLINQLSKCAQKAKDNSVKKEITELGINNIDVILKVSEKITDAKELDIIYNDTITSSLALSKYLGKDYNNTVNDKIINMSKAIIEKKSAINISDNKISVQNNRVLANIDADAIKNIDNIGKEIKELKDKLKNGGLDIEDKIENSLTINIPNKYKNEINISLAPAILENINNKGFKNIKLKNDIATFNVNKNTFENKKNLILSAAKLDSKALETLKVDIPKNSTIIELSAKEDDKLIENFNTMQIEIPYTISNENKDNLKVFYINEKENNVELVGGKYDEKTKALIFETNHFSKYFIKQINNRFTDLDDVKWAQDAIMDMAEKGIVKGKTDNKFAPNDNVTRAEFSALVTRILKYENADKALPFKDVSNNEWYFKSVASAYSNDLINGRNMNTFDPNGNITREEMAKIIANVLNKKGYKNSQINYITQFKDKENIAPWAKDHVSLCVKENIIAGMPDKRFAPSEKATRAQATVMLYRMYKIIANK